MTPIIHPLWIAVFFAASEVVISTVLRSGASAKSADKGSLALLWAVINVCMIGAVLAHLFLKGASFGSDRLYPVALAVFVVGIAIRWYSIYYLGRFFTVNVAIATDQTVIDTGPYRLVRHPSYTGVLLAFLAVGLLLANYVSLFMSTVPIIAVFLRRMQIEEAALLAGLGERYRNYMDATKRLIPFIY
jgi:protein-S-isoprenylcysteine O-methyltransferase